MAIPTWAQYDKVNFYPPEAASLMKYIDYPVSYVTGIPDIKIPLQSIKVGNKDIPIELSFHIDNYTRNNQTPGIMGVGWTLNPNIQITRSINGLDDFSANGYSNYLGNQIPSYYQGEFQSRDISYLRQMHLGYIDEQPDRFYYNLLDKSGVFYILRMHNGEYRIKTESCDGVKIIHETGHKFTAIDTDGVIYSFEKSDKSIVGNTLTQLAWKCEYIAFPSNDTLWFDYEKQSIYNIENFNTRAEVYDSQTVYDSFMRLKCITDGPSFEEITGPKMKIYGPFGTALSPYDKGQFHSRLENYDVGGTPARTYSNLEYYALSNIRYRGGSVIFDYIDGTGAYKQKYLHSLSFLKTGNEKRTFQFSQDGDGFSRTLNSIRLYHGENNRDYTLLNKFSYGFTPEPMNVVPDYWGYNGSRDRDMLASIPTQKITVNYGQSSKYYLDCQPVDKSIINAVIGGTTDIFEIERSKFLMSIQYQTGSSVKFYIGQNRFRGNSDKKIKGAGGYRIENIKYFESGNSNPVKEKVYKYGIEEDGTGIIKAEPILTEEYSHPTEYTEQVLKYIKEGLVISSERKRVFLSGSTRGNTFKNGSTVNYNEVAEYESDMGINSGKTIYKYNVYHFSSDYTSPTDPYPIEREEWDIATPDSIIIYKYNESSRSFEWIKKKKYLYNKYLDKEQIYSGRVWAATDIAILSSGNKTTEHLYDTYAVFNYKYSGLKLGCMQLVKEVEHIKNDDNSIIKEETEYVYNNKDSRLDKKTPISTKKKLSDGTELVTYTRFADDYDENNPITSSLYKKNMISLPIEKVQTRAGEIISGELYYYNERGQINKVYMLKDKILEAEFKYSDKNTFNIDPHYENKYTIEYGKYNNINGVTPDMGYPISYLWSYKGLYPIAEIKNISYQDVVKELGNSVIQQLEEKVVPNTNDFDKIKSLQTKYSNVLVTTYTYNPFYGMISQTLPSGQTTYYDYDLFGRLIRTYIIEDGKKVQLKSHKYNWKLKY